MYRQVPAFFNVPCSMDENPLFDSLNAGKEGIVLDLKTREGMEVMHRLLAEADIFITNNRKKALDRLGLNYESLKGKYPKLIFATITGFGDAGPKADAPGFDTVAFWASSGFNADMMVDEPGAYPVYSSSGPGDIISAMGLCYAITAALYKRTQTGIGDRVTISLYGTALWCFSLMAVASEERYGYKYPRTREQSPPLDRPTGPRMANGSWRLLSSLISIGRNSVKLWSSMIWQMTRAMRRRYGRDCRKIISTWFIALKRPTRSLLAMKSVSDYGMLILHMTGWRIIARWSTVSRPGQTNLSTVLPARTERNPYW